MRKILIGEVVSTKMQKTIVVRVERKFRHAKYQKVVIKHKKHKAHNESLELQVGDTVKIQATRPISKEVHFEVIEKITIK